MFYLRHVSVAVLGERHRTRAVLENVVNRRLVIPERENATETRTEPQTDVYRSRLLVARTGECKIIGNWGGNSCHLLCQRRELRGQS